MLVRCSIALVVSIACRRHFVGIPDRRVDCLRGIDARDIPGSAGSSSRPRRYRRACARIYPRRLHNPSACSHVPQRLNRLSAQLPRPAIPEHHDDHCPGLPTAEGNVRALGLEPEDPTAASVCLTSVAPSRESLATGATFTAAVGATTATVLIYDGAGASVTDIANSNNSICVVVYISVTSRACLSLRNGEA